MNLIFLRLWKQRRPNFLASESRAKVLFLIIGTPSEISALRASQFPSSLILKTATF